MLGSDGEDTGKQDRLEAFLSVFIGPGGPWRLLLCSPGVQVIQSSFFSEVILEFCDCDLSFYSEVRQRQKHLKSKQ